MKKIITFILSLALLTGCAKMDNNEEGKLNVVTSFFPSYDLVSRVGGEHVNVINLTETGSAHTYEPSIKDMENIVNSDLLVVNGANFESWLENVKESNPDLKVLEISEGIELLPSTGHHDHDHEHEEEAHDHEHEEETHDHEHEEETHDHEHEEETHDHEHEEETHDHEHEEEAHDHEHEEEAHDHEHEEEAHDHEHGHSHGEYDPHTWLSIKNPLIMLENVKDKLIEIDSENKVAYEENYEKAKKEFEALSEEYMPKFEKYQGRAFIAPHTAFGYLTHELGIEQIGIEGINSVNEPNAARMKEIIDTMNDLKIDTVFYEYGQSDKVANTIASEINGEAKPISTLEVISKEDRDNGQDFIKLMRMNLDNLLESFE